MSAKETFVIVGGGLAGAKAAEALREEGFEGRLVLVGEERELPYERPPLTKDYLRRESPREKALVHPEAFYRDHDIELMTGTAAERLDLARSRISLESGHELRYDRMLLATGADPRRIPVPGADLDGVHYLRTLEHCDELRDRLAGGGRLAVVGAGWIGAELAASTRQLGVDVTLIDPQSAPLERVLGPEIGAFYRDVHAENGVELVLGTGVEAFRGDAAVSAVVTTEGHVIECDYVVVGIGVSPRVELAEEAGIETADGIVVDETLATSAPNVYAAGDVASAWHPFFGRPVRVEHWANALNQGPAAARSMLGQPTTYDRLPYFFSDQYDVGMEYSGLAADWDEVVLRGDPATREFCAFWLSERRVVAAMSVNVWDLTEQRQAVIRSRRAVDAAALADPGTPIDSTAEAHAG